MHRIDNITGRCCEAGGVTSQDAGSSSGSRQMYRTGLEAIMLDYDWANAVQEEIVGVVVNAGPIQIKGNDGQLALAIHTIANS